MLGHMVSDAFISHTDRGSTGTKMPRTNWCDMSAFKITLPSIEAAGRFTEFLRSMLDRISQSIFEQRTLTALRDALLPQLMSGKIRIKDPEKFIGGLI
jgi:type I restriction enzyme S subunit